MRAWKKLLHVLTRESAGFNADGRQIGLGLAAAQDQVRRQTTEEVESFLRRRAADHRRNTFTS